MSLLHAKRAVVTVFAILLWLPIISAAENSIPVVPCHFHFDVSKNDSSLDEMFEVKEYRNYTFGIQFEYDNKDINRVLDLVGDGKFKVYTKESADTDHPVSPTNERQRDEGLISGAYVTRPTDFSGVIPIHIRLYKLDGGDIKSTPPIIDDVIQTLGYFEHGFSKFDEDEHSLLRALFTKPDGGYFERKVSGASLKPGRYRVQMNTITDSSRFSGIQTRLSIEPRPNENILTN